MGLRQVVSDPISIIGDPLEFDVSSIFNPQFHDWPVFCDSNFKLVANPVRQMILCSIMRACNPKCFYLKVYEVIRLCNLLFCILLEILWYKVYTVFHQIIYLGGKVIIIKIIHLIYVRKRNCGKFVQNASLFKNFRYRIISNYDLDKTRVKYRKQDVSPPLSIHVA